MNSVKGTEAMLTKPFQSHSGWRLAVGSFAIASLMFLTGRTAQAQFNSGSTGSDGAFAPTTSQAVQLPTSGIFNYTTINIPAGVTISFIPNANNTPVILLASGNVTIAGSINVNASAANGRVGGKGGPGGYRGGTGGVGVNGVTDGLAGDGPGGGSGGIFISADGVGYGGGGAGYTATGGKGTGTGGGLGGPAYGSGTLVPLLGGSGGGGGGARTISALGGGGGGGGGAILIASSGTISFSSGSLIQAAGTSNGGANDGNSGNGGGGSGGAIRLVANTISGTVTLDVNAGSGSAGVGRSGGGGLPGRIRIEAFDPSLNPTIFPSSAGVSFGVPQSAIPTNDPRLRIASVAGIAAPASPAGSLQAPPDIVVPASQTNPVAVALEASNIAPGLIADVTVTTANGARTTVQSTAFAGTNASSTATASVTLPDGSSVVIATATIQLTASAPPLFINGERVDRIEVAAVFRGSSEVTYITKSGKRIKKMPE